MKCVSACGCLLVEVKSLSQLHGQLKLRVMTLHLGTIIWKLLLGEVDGSIYWIYRSDVCCSDTHSEKVCAKWMLFHLAVFCLSSFIQIKHSGLRRGVWRTTLGIGKFSSIGFVSHCKSCFSCVIFNFLYDLESRI